MKTPFDFGAVGDGVADDTDAIQAALNSSDKRIVIPDGVIFGLTSVKVPDGKIFQVNGKLSLLPGAGDTPIVELSSNTVLDGGRCGEITGNNIGTRAGVASAGASNVVVEGIYVNNVKGNGIANYTSGKDWVVKNNRVYNAALHAIDIQRTSNILIADNNVDKAYHGIMWYGGDAAVSSKRTVENIRIIGNSVSNVMGGIWGTLGAHISVVGNHVIYCNDVGIDFEGCSLFTATGNTAAECKNGCYAVFYGSERGVITGNTGLNYSYPAACYYNHGGTSTNMVINTNAFNK